MSQLSGTIQIAYDGGRFCRNYNSTTYYVKIYKHTLMRKGAICFFGQFLLDAENYVYSATFCRN